MQHLRSILPLGAALVSQAPAQSHVTVPAFAEAVDRSGAALLPFGQAGFRTQLLVDASAIAPNGGTVHAIRFRGNRSSPPLAGSSVPNVTVRISQSSAAIGALSTTFANNVTGPTTVVFQGTVVLPAQAAASQAGPLPWNVEVPFTMSWPFTTASGNLLIDIVADNPAGGAPGYFLDATTKGGSWINFGTRGSNPGGYELLLTATGDADHLAPGNVVTFHSVMPLSPPPGFAAIGLSAPPSPLSLAPLGAPGNSLYVEPAVLSTHVWQLSLVGYWSNVQVAIPNLPSVVGALLYAQSAILSPTANPLGLVLSDAIEVQIGDPTTPLPLQQLDAADPNAAAGTLLTIVSGGPQTAATPIQLEGVFF